MTRYLSGLCAGGWLILAALAFNGEAGDAGRVNLVTGAVLVLAGGATALSWAAAWRRLRAVGVLAVPFPPVPRHEARRNRRQLARDVRTEQWPAEVPPAAQWRPQHWRARQEWTPPPRAGDWAVDDELQHLADGEEAWW